MTMNARLAALFLAAACVSTTTAARAADCRVTDNVEKSAQGLGGNNKAGGHVSIHIQGQKTEAGKSQFHTEVDFIEAWVHWAQYNGPKGPKAKTCGGGSAGLMDCVPANLIGMDGTNKGYVCDKLKSDGTCDQGHDITPVMVAFRYAKNGGKWILNTAYPSVNSNCQ